VNDVPQVLYFRATTKTLSILHQNHPYHVNYISWRIAGWTRENCIENLPDANRHFYRNKYPTENIDN
jgi:hypothetical protein